MPIEIASSDPETVALLQEIADSAPDQIMRLPIKPMEGLEILRLVIENYESLSLGTTALIVALKNRINHLKISKDGLEMSGSAREEILDGPSQSP